MTALRLDSSDRRLALAAVVLSLLSAAFVAYNFQAAFPQASLSLPLSPAEIEEKAAAVLRTRGLAPQGFRNITVFDPDEEARLYLERELGLEEANKVMTSAVPVWQWRARWFNPPEKEERIVRLTPSGRLVGLEHRIKETDSGSRLDRDSARLLAKAFLDGQTRLPHKLISERTESRPNRDDHSFTWEQESFKAKEATIRRTIVLQGDKIGSYREYLYIPEQWQRDFSKLRSSNELYASIANALYGVLAIGGVVVFLQSLRARAIPWRAIIRIGFLVALLQLLNGLNTIGLAIDGMKTSSSYPEMLLLGVLQSLGSGTGVFLYVLAPLAAGVVLFTRTYPTQLPVSAVFTLRGAATRSFFRATLAGFAMAAGHMIFVTAFYMIGAKAGVWSPQDVGYSDLLATPFPWLYPLSIAVMASTAEEFWFRLLAIPLLGRVLKIRWLVIAIPAFVWGFLHANYPQQPGYIRGVEVGIIGVAAGYVMLRFGLAATLIWHYTIDALLIGLFLFRADNLRYLANGAVVVVAILAPVVISLVLYRRNGGFLPELDAPAEPEAEPAQAATAVLDAPVEPPWPARHLYLAAAVFGVLGLMLRPVTFGDFIRIAVTRTDAEQAATAEMNRRNLRPMEWRTVAVFSSGTRPLESEYLRQQVGAAKANQLLEAHLKHAIWRVRFFKPLSPEEWIFYLDQRGVIYRTDHVLDEKAAGAKLTPQEARARAEAALIAQGHRLAYYNIVESHEEKRDNRSDHTFEFEDTRFRVGEAKLRISIAIIGDEACQYRPYLKLPEAWVRDRTRTRLTSFILPSLIGITGVPLLIALIRRLGSPQMRYHWRVYAFFAVLTAVFAAVDFANGYPSWLSGYDTSTPLANYFGQLWTGTVMSVLIYGVGAGASVLAADAFLQGLFPMRHLPPVYLPRTAAIAVMTAGMFRFGEWLQQVVPGSRNSPPLWQLDSLDQFLPAFSEFQSAWFGSVFFASVFAICVCGALLLLTRKGLLRLVAVYIVASVVSGSHAPIQVPGQILLQLIGMCAIALIVLTCATDILSLGLAIFWLACGAALMKYLPHPAGFLRWNAIALMLFAALVTFAIVRMNRTRGGQT
ncbi:MAG: CPBP family intramembrane metalloprotease [Bryobacterales bacterium]|nr:CPBP family intramembrane metalloprotease [Bryobacterales bacterium]